MPPLELLPEVADAHRRFAAAIRDVTNADVRRPSALPGWTVGHVLTHVARNADSHVRRTAAALRGEVIDQYPGGAAGRTEEIEVGASRSAADIVYDVARTSALVEDAWLDVPDDAWDNETRDVGGTMRRLCTLPMRRWQEVEVHLVDLGLGATHRDWSDAFVHKRLPMMRIDVVRRLPPGSAPPPRGALHLHDELAWLYGRLRRDDLPELAPWG